MKYIDGFVFDNTSVAYPEQYDVYLDGRQVGYCRVRYGVFKVETPDCGGNRVYTANVNGRGAFEDIERDYYLQEAAKAIRNNM